MQLRDYQQRSIDQLYKWFRDGKGENPCLVLPTGAGKSHIVAALCRDALTNWPETRVLMLTHVKELIEQNAEKMRLYWPNAPMGIYSASLRRKQLGEPITFAGIQSIRTKSAEIGHVDLIIVDECHLINHKDEGGYRALIRELKAINPALRVVGLTATPFRLGHGYITDGDAIFCDLIEPVTLEELIFKGHLAKLRSKVTAQKLDVSGVKKRGGEYIESELQKAVDQEPKNVAVVDEVISRAEGRKAWLFFCTGVDHSEHIAEALRLRGITAECVTGKTPKGKREQILRDFKAGKIQALTNANVLTTGFDYPDIDLIAMLRPTMSPALYIQMAGRGLRPKSHTDHCLVLDFAGVIEQHGPITNVRPPKKKGDGDGEAPVKVCPECDELVHLSKQECPECGFKFPPPEPKKMALHDDDIMGKVGKKMRCTGWQWRKQVSYNSGQEMLVVTYYGGLSDKPVKEYLAVNSGGWATQKALAILVKITDACEVGGLVINDLDAVAEKMNLAKPPIEIEYIKTGKFFDIKKREWGNDVL